MSYSVVVRAAAQVEAAKAFLWYEQRSRGLGDQFADSLRICLDQLAKNPKLQVQKNDFRYALLEKFPYRVVFVIEGTTVYVYQIRHTNRKPSKRFGP